MRKQSLPVFEQPPGPGGPDVKRLQLPQGDLAQFWTSDTGIRYIAWVEMVEGGIRGNHLHQRKEEWIYLIDGAIEVIVEDPGSKERAVVPVAPGDLLVIDPGVAHALRTLRAGQGIEFSPTRLDLSDSAPYPLVG